MFFRFSVIFGEISVFLQKFKNGKKCPTRTYRFDSRLCSPQVFTILVAPLVIHGCHRPGGQSAPPGSRLELANFWQYLPPLNRPPWFTFWSQNLKILKIKKIAPNKKMKCDNNSIYELQDSIYSSQGTPWHALWFIRWHFLDFKNSLQTIDYFMILTFLQKKKKSAKSAEKFLHDKYRLTSPLFILKQSSLCVIRRPRY